VEPTTLGFARLGFSIAAFILAASANIYAWWASRSKARRDEVDESLQQISSRLQALERDMYHSPSQQQIQDLHNRVGEVQREIGQMSGKLDGINRLADLMNEHLLNEGRKSR